MGIELHIEVSTPEEGKGNIQVQKAESENFSSLQKAEETYRERFLDAGSDRDIAVGAGFSMGLVGAWMILDGVTKNDAGEAAIGGAVISGGLSLSTYGLTVLQEKYKAATHALNQLRVRMTSIDK